MSNNFDNTNDGAAFKNTKRRSENSPNLTGNACIQCPHCGKKSEFWLSVWKKISRGGDAFLSLAFTPKEEQRNTSTTPPKQDIDFDEDIPF